MRKTADDAVKEIMDLKKKKEEEEEAKAKKKAKFDEFLHKKKIKREWKDMQETLLKQLGQRLHMWKFQGTWEARRDLYEILEAADAALRAQYFTSSQGLDPETGAKRAAEKAVASLGKAADQQTKAMMAKKAADLYIKQDGERKKAIEMIDKSLDMLGPQDKTRPNPYLSECVNRVREIIIEASKKPDAPEDPLKACKGRAEEIQQRLTGKAPSFENLRDGTPNPFLINFDKPLENPKIEP